MAMRGVLMDWNLKKHLVWYDDRHISRITCALEGFVWRKEVLAFFRRNENHRRNDNDCKDIHAYQATTVQKFLSTKTPTTTCL